GRARLADAGARRVAAEAVGAEGGQAVAARDARLPALFLAETPAVARHARARARDRGIGVVLAGRNVRAGAGASRQIAGLAGRGARIVAADAVGAEVAHAI